MPHKLCSFSLASALLNPASLLGGETGLQRYFSNSLTSDDSDEIYNAVFALARLFLTPAFAPWTAELLSTNRGDFFIPCLMLLEAEQRGSSFNSTQSNSEETNTGDHGTPSNFHNAISILFCHFQARPNRSPNLKFQKLKHPSKRPDQVPSLA